jgi:prenyltransferase beta subunit
MELLECMPSEDVISRLVVLLKYLTFRMVNYLGKCQHPTGGFGGGPGQIPHLAPTYAAINALVICGTEEAYEVIDRFTERCFLSNGKGKVVQFSAENEERRW